jgi:hypothetical protein
MRLHVTAAHATGSESRYGDAKTGKHHDGDCDAALRTSLGQRNTKISFKVEKHVVEGKR